MTAHPTAPSATTGTTAASPPLSGNGAAPALGLAVAPPAVAHLAPERALIEEQSRPQPSSTGHGTSALGPPPAAPVSPILARSPAPPPPPRSPNPEFAELLTPAKLRRRRRPNPRIVLPPSAGPSRDGWQTGDDVYRGAIADPTAPVPVVGPLGVEDDAVSLGSGSSSSSSSSSSSGSGSTWSIVSDLERGRRRTVAAIERFGERVGLRRGSDSSSEHSVGSMLERQQERHRAREREKERQGQGKRRMSIGMLSRTLTRRSSIDSTATSTAPRRQYIPRKRVFTLLAERETTTTPNLDNVLLRIQAIRALQGLDTPVPTRGGSAPGRKRPVMSRGATSFVPPPVPRPARTQSRLTVLRGVKPLTPAELMGLPSPASAPNLSALKEFPSTPVEERARTSFGSGSGSSSGYGSDGGAASAPAPGKTAGPGCWWLDVACPTWEDLRDIGELLALHPLTLEDVLQQDPREKMDAFDKLGYYFVAVRALDETYFKYTPGTTSVARIGKGAGKEDKDKDTEKDGDDEIDSPELSGRREGRRRGWGMGRAALVGKLAGSEGKDKVEIVEDNPGREGLEGVGVGAVNVYLAVFADGIVTFHFDDISKHTARVRERIMAGATEYTSDSVAHGILDSIVDAFFPLVRYVDGEVDEIDSLTIDPTVNPRSRRAASSTRPVAADETGGSPDVRPVETDSERTASSPPQTGVISEPKDLDEKASHSPSPAGSAPPRLSLRRLRSCMPTLALGSWTAQHRHTYGRSPGLLFSLNPFKNVSVPRHKWGLVYLRLFFLPITSAVRQYPRPLEPVFDRSVMLRRIVELRRIVTGMTRMLGAKGQVVARLRKTLGERGMGGVEAYVGDVEDHILLLQTSLYHHEYILAHCQPTYLSHLKYSYHITRRLISKRILILSTVAVSILPIQIVTSLFGMNVEVPQDGIGAEKHVNADGSPAGYTWFGIIIGIIFVIVCCMCALMRTWRWQARRKFQVERGKEVPDWWDGFWGWK